MNAIAKDTTSPTSAVQNLPIHLVHPHPRNPRLSPRQDVVEQITAQIADGFDAAHALIVRPLDIGYQIISGHHRFEAAKQAGLSEVPCWVRDLSDEEAYMQLVLCNTQSELHPLEEGKHAAESGMDLKAYAERAIKNEKTLNTKVRAFRVLKNLHVEIMKKADLAFQEALWIDKDLSKTRRLNGKAEGLIEDARDSWRNLAEIHAAPRWLWAALVEKMIEDEWTVQVTREKVGKVKEVIKELPSWIDENALAKNIVNNSVKVGDIGRMLSTVNDTVLTGEFLEGLRAELETVQVASLSDIQGIHHRWTLAMEADAAKRREEELAKQREQEAASARVERLRVNCSLDEWNTLSQQEREELLNLEPYAATLNEQKNQDIEWAQWSWNPVTGCKHECSYCYARDIALSERMKSVYPNGFEPSFRSRSLNAPFRQKVPTEAATDTRYKNVFTCSMADLFGRWVPEEWINAVLGSVRNNPQWNFLFLTKFPKRMAEFEIPDNAWMGTSVDLQARVKAAEDAFANVKCGVRWLSIEPMLEPLKFNHLDRFDWVVIGGASSSSQTPAWFPPIEWVLDIINQCRAAGVKVYLKSNLFGTSDTHRAINARILELPFDAPVTQDPSLVLPESLKYLGK